MIRIVKPLRLFKLIRIIKVVKTVAIADTIAERFRIPPRILRLIKVTFFSSCLFLLPPVLEFFSFLLPSPSFSPLVFFFFGGLYLL